MNNTYLFLFSISPVQSFISQARKTKDLYAGSVLLSNFIKNQIEFLKKEKTDAEIIFPMWKNNSDKNGQSLPNRFVAKINAESDDEIVLLGQKLQKNFKDILKKRFENLPDIISKGPNKDIYLNQVLNIFESYWAAVKEEDNNYQNNYIKLEKIHAAAKNIKKFKQLNNGNGEQGRKCSLCGERNAYFYGNYDLPAFINENFGTKICDSRIQFTKNEALCTACSIKRFYNVSFPSIAEITLKGTIPEDKIAELSFDAELFYDENLTQTYFKKNNMPVSRLDEIKNRRNKILEKNNLKASSLPKYYALIMFDGDNMGKFLAGDFLREETNLEEFHKILSMVLSEGAKKARNIVDKYGKTVYAGGDDFLGFVPLKSLMPVLKELRTIFKEYVNDRLNKFIQKEITISAGIAIAHYKIPLKTVLDWARTMEKEAKEKSRDSFAIAVLKHSGEIHKTVWKWYDSGKSNVDRIEKILHKLIKKKFSANFIHALEEEFRKLSSEENILVYKKQFQAELKRLIAKSILLQNNSDSVQNIAKQKEREKEELYNLCNKLFLKAFEDTENYFSLMKIVDFIARHLGGER